MAELKPCYHCGGEVVLKNYGNKAKPMMFIKCKGRCKASVTFPCKSVEEFVKIWNTRFEPRTPGGAYVPAGNERLHKWNLKKSKQD